jgi:hypothetical protein
VYNAVNPLEVRSSAIIVTVPTTDSNFSCRVTLQKGRSIFIEAAHLVLKHMKNVRFVWKQGVLLYVQPSCSSLRIGDKFHFTGFVRGDEVKRMFAQAMSMLCLRFQKFWHFTA